MKILFLTQYYLPEMGAPQARISELAENLDKLGNEVEILTALPNYPTGKILRGYNKIFIEEKINGINVKRTWIYPSKSKNILTRILCYFSFVVSSTVFGLLKLGKYDYVFVESPPLFISIAACLINLKIKAKIIFNVSDLWPDSALDMGLVSQNWKYSLMKNLERYSYNMADIITGQSPTIVNLIKKTIDKNKTVLLLSNGVDTEKFSPRRKDGSIKEKFGISGKFTFVYAGLHGLAQGLDQIVDIAKKFNDDGISDVVFLLIGDGPEKNDLIKYTRMLGLKNVIFHGPVNKEEIPIVLSSMDAAIIPLRTNIKGAVPSKIYEAMASGLPILYIGYGDALDILERGSIGCCVEPGNIESAFNKAKLLYLNESVRNAFTTKALRKVKENYSRKHIVNEFNKNIKNFEVKKL